MDPQVAQSLDGPFFHLRGDCEQPLLYLPGTRIASLEIAISGCSREIFLPYAIVTAFGGQLWDGSPGARKSRTPSDPTKNAILNKSGNPGRNGQISGQIPGTKVKSGSD